MSTHDGMGQGGSRGGSGSSLEPHIETKLFHFHGKFQNKIEKK